METLGIEILTLASGAIVGLVLGLVGGGGSILAVPLLVYAVGLAPPHMAIGTSALAVSVSAFASLLSHWRAGTVKWPCAATFTAAGVLGTIAGSSLAKAIDGEGLLVLFGLLMLGVGAAMLRRRNETGDPDIRLSGATARRLLPLLLGIGFGVGLLSGFFGIGGGFLIVPGLMLATGMPLNFAIGTSLVAVTGFGAATAASYALSGLVDWHVAGVFIAGGLIGGLAGVALGKIMGRHGRLLGTAFAVVVILTGIYVLVRSILAFNVP